jgi:hypothetical protein
MSAQHQSPAEQRTCVDGYVWFPKRAEALVEPLIQLQAIMVCCSGDAEHHDTKSNRASAENEKINMGIGCNA